MKKVIKCINLSNSYCKIIINKKNDLELKVLTKLNKLFEYQNGFFYCLEYGK